MKSKDEVLKDFQLLAKYLEREGKLKDLEKYKQDFSSFLNHADHIAGYNFVAPFCTGKKLLDIGCFLGYGEKILARYAKETVAIDGDDKAIKFARKINIGTNIKFLKVDATQLPFSDETFDIVIAFQLIEHLPPKEVHNFLCEAKRVLKNGGLLFATTPNRKFRLLPFQQPFNPEHYQEFTARRLFKTLKSVFDEVQIKGVRAKGWIEEIARKRVRRSPFHVYVRTPISRFLNIFFLIGIKILLKKYQSKRIKSSRSRDPMLNQNNEFNDLFDEFTMDDFFLVNRMLDKSMDLFTICKK